MKITPTNIEGLLIIESTLHHDSRGFFIELYKESEFAKQHLPTLWPQDNLSRSHKNVLRGLHLQVAPKAQAKLVRVIQGRAFDVAVDLRPKSKSFGKWFGVELSEQNMRALLIPEGFAHGFCALEDNTLLTYKCSALYAPEYELGLRWNDLEVDIRWPISNPLLSPKDAALPALEELKKHLVP